jgi:hypothetical protein
MFFVGTLIAIGLGLWYVKTQGALYQQNQADLQAPAGKEALFVEDLRKQIIADTFITLIAGGICVYFIGWALKEAVPQFPDLQEPGFLPRSYRHRMIYGDDYAA